LFKSDPRVSIAEIGTLALFFPSFVNEENNRDLMDEVTEDELKEIFFSFQKEKSPGPDGWTIEFFQCFFELIGPDILYVVKESRQQGHMHAPLNATFISLIPKMDDPHSFDDFRPISPCNCIYKIISKIISCIIKSSLTKNISCE
jgi:hypothetical protein